MFKDSIRHIVVYVKYDFDEFWDSKFRHRGLALQALFRLYDIFIKYRQPFEKHPMFFNLFRKLISHAFDPEYFSHVCTVACGIIGYILDIHILVL